MPENLNLWTLEVDEQNRLLAKMAATIASGLIAAGRSPGTEYIASESLAIATKILENLGKQGSVFPGGPSIDPDVMKNVLNQNK